MQAHLLVVLLLSASFLTTHTYAARQLQTGLEKFAGKLGVATAVLEDLAKVL